jgi:hypothetical protein
MNKSRVLLDLKAWSEMKGGARCRVDIRRRVSQVYAEMRFRWPDRGGRQHGAICRTRVVITRIDVYVTNGDGQSRIYCESH